MRETLYLLVMFAYRNTQYALPGGMIDLFRMVEYIKKTMCDREKRVPGRQSQTRLLCVTDMLTEESFENLEQPIKRGDVSVQVCRLLSDLKRDGVLISWISGMDVSFLMSLAMGYARVFLYFSGHGENGNLLLPNRSFVPITDVVLDFQRHVDDELVCLLDCCHVHAPPFPFYIDKTNLTTPWQWTGVRPSDWPKEHKCQVLVLAGGSEGVSAVTSVSGSRFTLEFFTHSRKIPLLVDFMNACTRCFHIWSTHAPRQLPVWVTGLPIQWKGDFGFEVVK